MKRTAGAMALGCSVLAMVSGCAQLLKEGYIARRTAQRAAVLDSTMTQPLKEQLHSQAAVVDTDAKALVEDWDAFWQRDRPTRLTRWHER
jgi:hypothetical protein